ncbi:hypothetical protein BDZ91DRAFT_710387 [Kalaharituber pfeilii]|nr:hypothetical protein BDZ91DRAFT_710387 [Kalaharituber pfeilii]
MPQYIALPEPPTGKHDACPALPRSTHSFTRMDSSPSKSVRSSTLKLDLDPSTVTETVSSSAENSDDEETPSPLTEPLPEGFDELPPDIMALSDKFIESLIQTKHPVPLSADNVSDLFQEFYTTGFKRIKSYISTLYLSLSSKKKKLSSAGPETQMLSMEEIAQKKKDRRLLSANKIALEEALERRTCEKIYDRIWRHKSTDDEARDESLRSKTETLKVVGVKLEHLDVSGVNDEEMIEALASARDAICKMSEMRCPVAKLDLIRLAHKSVVDTLSTHNSDSSADRILPTLIFCLIHCPPSITVISDLLFIQRFRARKAIDGEAAYCLTNLEAAISFLENVDLASLKLDGYDGKKVKHPSKKESDIQPSATTTATTTTITSSTADVKPSLFETLTETQDSSPAETTSSRATSRGRKPVRDLKLGSRSRSETPFIPADDPLSNLSAKLLSANIDYSLKAAEQAWENELAKTPSPWVSRFPDSARNPKVSLQPAMPQLASADVHQSSPTSSRTRALSYLTNPVVDVAGTVVNTADVGIKTIGSTLENSYKFLFGKMDEKKAEMPKTLADARKLVEQPVSPPAVMAAGAGNKLTRGDETPVMPMPSPAPSPLLARPGQQVFSGLQAASPIPNAPSPAAALAAVGTSLTRIAGNINVMRPFGRSSSNVSLDKEKEKALLSSAVSTAPNAPSHAPPPQELDATPPPVSDLLSTFPELASPLMKSVGLRTGGIGTEKVPTVVERFMTVEGAGELRVSEVEVLLREYKRLGEFVRELAGGGNGTGSGGR